jgi:hypothetical protein
MKEPRRRSLVPRSLVRMLAKMAQEEGVQFELQVEGVKIQIKPAGEDPIDRKLEIVL